MKAFAEHWIYDNTIECPELIMKDALIKYEIKMRNLKEEMKDERKDDLNSKSDEKMSFIKNE